MTELELSDGRLAQFWLGGADSGPLVLLFHGCPDTRHVAMTGAEAARAAGVRLLCVNRPGYGRSTAHASTHASVADDAMFVARSLGHEQVCVLGMSIGGAYAVATAARYPSHVTGMGLVATQWGVRADGSVDELVEQFRPGFLEHVENLDPRDRDDERLAARFLALLPGQDAALLGRRGPASVAASVREALASPEGYLRDAALAHRPWAHDPSAVSCPTTVWFGELDDRAGLDQALGLLAGLPHARVVVRPGTTHLATLVAHWDDVLARVTSSG